MMTTMVKVWTEMNNIIDFFIICKFKIIKKYIIYNNINDK